MRCAKDAVDARRATMHPPAPLTSAPGKCMLRFCLLASLFATLTLDPAAAQQPTQAQRDAIRASCRSDFIAHCSGVEPGGKEALECLMRNDAKLSAACK